MTALIILCIVLIIVTLGSLFIKTLDPGTKDLKTRIDNQDKEIKRLNSNINSAYQQIYSLNQTIILNQRQCTNQIVQRENEITKIIDDLIHKKRNEVKITTSVENCIVKNEKMSSDQIPLAKSVFVPKNNDNEDNTINDLLSLKKKIKGH